MTSRFPCPNRVWALAGLLILLAAGEVQAAKEQPKGGEARAPSKDQIGFYATTFGRSAFEVVIVQYWSKGDSFRSETIVAGHPIVTLVRGKEYFTWDALTGEGYVVARTDVAMARDKERERPFGTELQEILDQGGEKIRSETLNGIRVDVYRVTDGDGRRTLWVDADRLDLPVRLETYDRQTGRTGNLDWINWIPGLVIPDAFFEPPPDLKLVRYETYEQYLDRLRQGPIPPTPPLFHYLLHERVQPGK